MQVWNVLHAARCKCRMQKKNRQKSPSGHHRTTLVSRRPPNYRCPRSLPQTLPHRILPVVSDSDHTSPHFTHNRCGRVAGAWLYRSVCINHAPASPAVVWTIHRPYWPHQYSTHRLLVVWIIVAHFHLCSLLDCYTVLEVWAVRRPMHVCCGSRWGRCVLFINIWGPGVKCRSADLRILKCVKCGCCCGRKSAFYPYTRQPKFVFPDSNWGACFLRNLIVRGSCSALKTHYD